MPDTVRVIIRDKPAGSEFADIVPSERLKPAPLIVLTSMFSLYVMVMLLSESTEAAVILGGVTMLFSTVASAKLAREFGRKVNGFVSVYSFTSLPVSPTTNIFPPLAEKARSWNCVL